MRLLPLSLGLSLCLGLLAITLATAPAHAKDWPQWLGPDGTGANTTAKPPSTLDLKTGKNIRWATDMPGPSAATPIVVGDYVFSPTEDTKTQRLLACGLDRKTGKILWKHDITAARKSRSVGRENNHAECTPVADDKHVYFIFGSGDLVAFTHAGKKAWQINLSKKFSKIEIMWGYSSSPLLIDGKLYIQVLRRKPDSLLICVDAKTGNVDWKHARPTQALGESLEAYTSPIAATIDGKTQVVVYGSDALTGHDPKTGKELWRFTQDVNPRRDRMFRVISGPSQGNNGLIYFTTPRGHDLFAVEVKNNTPKLKWSVRKVDADVPCPVYYKGAVFVFSGAKKRLYKFDADTGKELWQTRLKTTGYFRGAPTIADGRIYVLTGQADLFILSAGDKFKQLAEVKIGGYPTRATVAIAGNELYIRTGNKLVCAGE